MVVTQQVQHPMHNEQLYLRLQGMTGGVRLGLGARDRDEDIADITRAGFRVRFGGGEGEHIRWRVDTKIIQIQFLQVFIIC